MGWTPMQIALPDRSVIQTAQLHYLTELMELFAENVGIVSAQNCMNEGSWWISVIKYN